MGTPLDRIARLYRAHAGAPPASVLRVAGDGSGRRYHRLVGPDGRTAIGAFGPDPDENRAFLSFSRSFRDVGLPVPEIYAADEPARVWLMEDLGDTTLFDALVEARRPGAADVPEGIVERYRRVLETLPRFQVEGGAVVDYSVAYPHARFDRQSILWDLNYFKYHFLKLGHVPFHEARLERDFDVLASFLLGADADHFLYRDFQSRNVMLRDGEPWFVDYQGGRRGALQYDVASLLYDAKADLPEQLRAELLDHYLDALAGHVDVDRDSFCARYQGFVLVRIMQAMGAYGYRGFFERKPRFLESVPYAAANIRRLLERDALPVELPEIEGAFRRIVDAWAPEPETGEAGAGLTVDVRSFSYRRGYPEDLTGHGGGFVFDCRALPNPGRLPEYAGLTGRDPAVTAYLSDQPAYDPFWMSVRTLVEGQVEEYRRRGFSSLSVAFGCTGGQHRSVALAERLAGHLRQAFPDARVRVAHREEPDWPQVALEEEEAGGAGPGAPARSGLA